MEFLFGLVVGLVLAAIAGAVGAFFFLRDTRPVSPPAPAPSMTDAALTVTLIEALLNQQLRESLTAPAAMPTQTTPAAKARVPFHLKLNDARLELQPGSRGTFIAQMTVTLGPVKMGIRPITDLYFVAQAGKLCIRVSSVQLRGATVPRDWIAGVINEMISPAEAQFNQPLLQVQQELNVALADVETTDDMLILKFRGQR